MDVEIPGFLWVAIAGLLYILTEFVKQSIKGRRELAAAQLDAAAKLAAAELVAKKVEEVKAELVTKGDKADGKLDHIVQLTNSTSTDQRAKINTLGDEVTALKSDILRTAAEAVAKAMDDRLSKMEELLKEGQKAKTPALAAGDDPVHVKIVDPEVLKVENVVAPANDVAPPARDVRPAD